LASASIKVDPSGPTASGSHAPPSPAEAPSAVLDRERGGGPAPLDDIPLVRIEVLLDLALELGLLREREGGERSDDGNDSSARQQTHEMTSAVVTGTTIRRSVTPRIRKGGDQLS